MVPVVHATMTLQSASHATLTMSALRSGNALICDHLYPESVLM